MTIKNLDKFYLTDSTQDEIHKTLYDLSFLHPFFSNHDLIKNFLSELNDPSFPGNSYISNEALLCLRDDIVKLIAQLSKQTLQNKPEVNLVRISEQNILSIGFQIISSLIQYKEIRAYKNYLNSKKLDDNFEIEIDEILEIIKTKEIHETSK